MSDKTDRETLEKAFAEWSQRLEEKLTKRPERKTDFTNTSGIPIRRVYTPLDAKEIDYLADLGFPGEYPFTRGVQPTMYRGR
jgi:methylmalonyl-CoA mutase N-terminal domain/subunit